MDPDDAADLIAELSPELAETILGRMEPEEAEDVRTLLSYDASTAGGLMSPEPIILATDATVADALAMIRHEDVTPAMAAMAYICRRRWNADRPFPGRRPLSAAAAEPPSMLASQLVDNTVAPCVRIAASPRSAGASPRTTWCARRCRRPDAFSARSPWTTSSTILPRDWRDIQLHGPEEADGATD